MTNGRPICFTNSLGQRLEEFQPIEPPLVRIYSCGPTVYNYVHLGNFRAYLVADTLRRVLAYNGYEVIHVRNITDVGHLTNDTLGTGADRIEAMARKENVTPQDIARYYTDVFFRDARLLNLLEPQHNPRATEYVPQMLDLTRRLVERGYAYPADGNVYFEVASFPRYGALSGNTVEELIAGARVEPGEAKRAPADFALWRAAGPDRLMRWDSAWGEGVPGWHVECSAMSMTLLGEQIDIHTGGVDNKFPHHEDELAQSEAATGKTFVRYWLHNEWLVLSGDEKMSKSLGNIYSLADVMERGIHPYAYRYFTFQAHYRRPLNFSWDALEAAQTALYRLWEAAAELVQSGVEEEIGPDIRPYLDRFHASINQDLDMPGALAVLHETLATRLPPGQKLAFLRNVDPVLGLDLIVRAHELSETSAEQRRLLDRRAQARAAQDWATSDSLRSQLAETGLEVKDTPQGQRWVRRDLFTGATPAAAQV